MIAYPKRILHNISENRKARSIPVEKGKRERKTPKRKGFSLENRVKGKTKGKEKGKGKRKKTLRIRGKERENQLHKNIAIENPKSIFIATMIPCGGSQVKGK